MDSAQVVPEPLGDERRLERRIAHEFAHALDEHVLTEAVAAAHRAQVLVPHLQQQQQLIEMVVCKLKKLKVKVSMIASWIIGRLTWCGG